MTRAAQERRALAIRGIVQPYLSSEQGLSTRPSFGKSLARSAASMLLAHSFAAFMHLDS